MHLFAYNIYLIDLPLLLLVVSVVYSATRFDHWASIVREAVRWGVRLVAFLVAVGLVLYVAEWF
jgi:hypothetical protein